MRSLRDLSKTEREALGELQRRLHAECPDWSLRMTVFGSRARGEADPDSDMDVLIEVETDRVSFADKGRLRRVVGDVSSEFGIVISTLIADRRLREERGDFSIFQTIREEGIPV